MKLLKNQAVAWVLTIVMIAAAVGIGWAKGHSDARPPASSASYVRDDAGVLSDKTVRTLDERNDRLQRKHDAVIGVATCNYGRDDLMDHAWDQADRMGLGSYDMIVMLDIRGENYCLLTNPELLSDDDCTYYAWTYMEKDFARGDYDKAVLKLTEALEDWYDDYYG